MSALGYLKSFVHFSFSGRASAKEYTIINLGGITLLLCSYILFGPLGIVALSLYLVPLMNSAAVRRSHDMESKNINIFNRGNWGKLYYVESDEGCNKYGPEPADSKRNLRIAQNQKDIEKLLTLNRNSKKRDKELNAVIKRLSIVDNDRLSLDLLAFLFDDRIVMCRDQRDITIGDVCLYVMILQLLPPQCYWDKEAFLSPYRTGKDGKEHLRPFTFNDDFEFSLFTPIEFRKFIEENKSTELHMLRQKVIKRIIDMETRIGFMNDANERAIMEPLKHISSISML